MMESPESERAVPVIAMEFPVIEGSPSCSPPTMPTWLRKRLSEPKTPPSSTVEEIEAKLRDADLRRQKFYEDLAIRAKPKPRSPSRSSSSEDDLGQRLEAKLQAAEEKRLSILTNAQMRLARLDELRLAAKAEAEMRFKRQQAELGAKVEMRVRQAEANRLLILRAYRQRRATLKERTSQSLQRRMTRESKYKERVHAALCQKRAAAERKRLGLLEAEKRRARARALQVQNVANSVNRHREIERNKKKKQLEDRLQRARRKRAEYLMQRGRPYNTAQCSWNMMHAEADILSRKLARCWRIFTKLGKTTAHLAKLYNEFNINERSAKSMPFEQLALLIQSASTLNTAKAFLDRLEYRCKLSRAVGSPPNSSSWNDISHLLKRVASPKRKVSPKKPNSSREGENAASVTQDAKTPAQLSRYQVRVVLCAYMILGHPDAVISGQGEREAALVRSAEKFVHEFELLIKILLDGPLNYAAQKSDHETGMRLTFRSQLAAFDSAWCSFLNSFVVWKSKDARSLEEDLVRAACHLELSMIQTCKMTPDGASGPLSYDMKAVQKQVSEDQKLLREKVLHLSGDAGIERMENALSETREKFFNARENGEPITPLSALMLSPNPSSPPISSSAKERNSVVGAQNQKSVVRSLFRDEAISGEVNSPSSSSTSSQSSGDSLNMQNVMIVNEYVHGEHLSFADDSSFSGDDKNIMATLKETMKKAFWDGIIESVKQDEPNYSRVVELMREVRDEISAIAPSWRPEIYEAIDLEILTQVLNSGELDIDYMGKILEFALVTLEKLSAPASEEELKKKHHKFMKEMASENSRGVALVKGLRFVLEETQELKQEISKARIRMMEPFLKGPNALYYLGKAFTSRYGHPSNASAALPLTAKWILSVRTGKDEAWNDHKNNSLAELAGRRESSSSLFPSTTLRTGGSVFVKGSGNQADASSVSKEKSYYIETIAPHLECKGEEIDLLVRLGLIKLVSRAAGLTEDELPETMNLNLVRLRSVQSQFQKIIVIATSLLVLRQTLLSQQIVTDQPQMEGIVSNSVKQLLECLDSNADAGIHDIIETLGTAAVTGGNITDANIQPMKDLMARMLTKSLQEGDAVFKRVSQTVYLAARGVVLGGTGKQGRELAELSLQKVGSTLLVDKLVDAASVLVVTAKVSVIVHGPWYANLTKE